MIVCLGTGPGLAAAQSFEGAGGTVVVAEGETIESIDGVAGSIVVRGTVTGDLSGAAGSIHVTDTGRIGGTVEAAAGSIRIDGVVEGDVRVGTGSFELTDTGRVGGDINLGAASVRIDGTVDGNVRAGASEIVIGPNANVGGEFRYDADEFTQHQNAVIEGGVVQDPNIGGDAGTGVELVSSWVGTVYGVVASLVFGVLLLAVFPRFSTDVATRVLERPIRSGGVGLATLVGVPIVLLLIAITIVGLPIALIGVGVFVVAIWAAVIYGKYAVGTWVLGLVDVGNRWLALVVGLVGFALLGTIPFVGGLLEFVAFLLGLGALVGGLYGRYRDERSRGSGAKPTPSETVAGSSESA